MLRFIVCIGAMAAALLAQPLRDLGDQRKVKIGTAVDPSHFNETAYAATLSREFSQVEPENAMKFGPIHPASGAYNFGPADAIASFAADHDMALRGHTLVWHNQNPSWVTGGNHTPDELSSILHDHISTVVGRYAGKVYAWDVVNEAFNDNGTMRSTIWSDPPGIGLPGTAYIEQAFRWAHDADPKALLFYNDYNAEGTNAKSDAIYKMAQDFKSRGVPIDGIGMQMHFTNNIPTLASMESNIKRITALGLQVQITEFDVRLPVDSTGKSTDSMLQRQAQIYHDVVALCLKFPGCTAIQTWGFTDKYSWVPATFSGMGAALEFDTNYQPKPAYDSMKDALQTSPPVIAEGALGSAASYATDAVAPGELVVLYGATFGPASLATAAPDDNGVIGTDLSGTRLLFDGAPAPVVYSQVGQMSAVVPFEVAGNTTTQVVYEYQGIQSNAITVNVAPARPGIFTLDASGQGDGAILDLSYHVVSASNPVHRGDYILLFATGGGVTTPSSADGQVALSTPFPQVAADVGLKIGGVTCPVQYAGAAYGLVAGAVQINAQIADGVAVGEQPVVVTIGGVDSQPGVTVAVQ